MRVPSRSGTASNSGAAITVNSGRMCRQFSSIRAHKELAHKERVPRVLGNHADGQTISRVRAAVKILNKQVARAHVVQNPVKQGVKALGGECLVHFSPMDKAVRDLVVHNEFVFGAAAGSRSGGGHQRAVCRQMSLAALESDLDQLRNRRVCMHVRS